MVKGSTRIDMEKIKYLDFFIFPTRYIKFSKR